MGVGPDVHDYYPRFVVSDCTVRRGSLYDGLYEKIKYLQGRFFLIKCHFLKISVYIIIVFRCGPVPHKVKVIRFFEAEVDIGVHNARKPQKGRVCPVVVFFKALVKLFKPAPEDLQVYFIFSGKVIIQIRSCHPDTPADLPHGCIFKSFLDNDFQGGIKN